MSISHICRACRLQIRSCGRVARPQHARLTNQFHTSVTRREYQGTRDQPRGLGDFYNDLIAKPLPKSSNATTSETSLPDWVASGGRKEIEERAKKLFGTIEGSGYQRTTSDTPDSTWQTINGVPVPPRPAEPENCCMSGCVHCVWDDYRDDVEQWAARVREVQAKHVGISASTSPKAEMPRPELSAASTSMDDDGGGSEALWTSPSPAVTIKETENADSLFQDIPIGIREFMAVEKRIRERKRSKISGQAVNP